MVFQGMLSEIDWATVFCFLVQVLASSSLPTLSKLLLTHLHFPYPATLSFIHVATVAICLWFWTILNIFHPRSLPFRSLAFLSVSAAVNGMLNMIALSTSSLLHYQLSRFLLLSLLSPSVHAVPFIIGSLVLVVTHCPTALSVCTLAASVIATLFDKSGPIARVRCKTRGTDLQLQLMVRTFAALISIPVLPLLDDYSKTSALPSRLVSSEDSTPFFLYSTGLLSFFAFVSLRVSHSKLHPNVFRAASILSGLPVFIAHFTVYESVCTLDVLSIALVLMGAFQVIMTEYPDDTSSIPDSDSPSDDSDLERSSSENSLNRGEASFLSSSNSLSHIPRRHLRIQASPVRSSSARSIYGGVSSPLTTLSVI